MVTILRCAPLINYFENCKIYDWFRHYATNQKTMGLIPNNVTGFFNCPYTSSHTMALGTTQSLIEMRTKNLSGLKGSLHIRLTTSQSSVS
jgi:hypothetical protein